jgi:CRP-like cAMP-binding protein
METLKKQLNEVCDYRMEEETMDRFLGLATEFRLKNKELLIPYGKLDDNVYILKEGIVRFAYFDGLSEKTFSFSTPGNLIISYHSFYKHIPTSFQYESCGESVILRVPKAKFDELLRQSRDFTDWILRMSMEQLWCREMKATVINGSATERFEALLKNRPEILKRVSNKIIASYIGIEPPSLSRLKRRLMLKSKNSGEGSFLNPG